MTKKLYSFLFIVLAHLIPICAMEDPNKDARDICEPIKQEDESTLLALSRKTKFLYKMKASSNDYKKIVLELKKNNLSVVDYILDILLIKMKAALKEIENEWRVPSEVSKSISEFLAIEFKKSDDIDIESYRLETPDNLKKNVESDAFKNLINYYLQLSGLKHVTIKFSHENAFGMKAATNEDNVVSYDFCSYVPYLTLGYDFFDYSEEEQEFTIAHEITHALMHHATTTMILSNYCANSLLLNVYNELNNSEKSMPCLRDWITGNNREQCEKITLLLSGFGEDIYEVVKEIRSSHSFLQLGHAKEYMADSFLIGIGGLKIAKKFRKCFQEKFKDELAKNQEKIRIGEPEISNKSTHPSWQKRFVWMDTIVKLLEAEELLLD